MNTKTYKSSLRLIEARILNWITPNKCLLCGDYLSHGSIACEACYVDLPFQSNCCTHCGQLLSNQHDFCGHCLDSPPSFDHCYCAFSYESPISDKIQLFKYGEKPELAALLASLLSQELQANDIRFPELLIPVPMHISKLRSRGYNQSLELTKQLSRLINVPFRRDLVVKQHRTASQATLNLSDRKKNVRGSFKAISSTHARSVAIVDDVFTTGATAEEIAKILKRIGVDYIQIWGVAHTQ